VRVWGVWKTISGCPELEFRVARGAIPQYDTENPKKYMWDWQWHNKSSQTAHFIFSIDEPDATVSTRVRESFIVEPGV